jgi:molybdenum cofactor cytidylyltransferase
LISAIVLAAGAGTRFGGTKQIEPFGGKPLAQHAIDAAVGGGVDEILVVLGHDAERVHAALDLPANARIVVNQRYAEGQATSLTAGLQALNRASRAAIVLLGDQPGIGARHVAALVAAYRDARPAILRIGFRDRPGPALLDRSVWHDAMELTGDQGARALFDADPDRVSWVSIDEDAPQDVDVREDLERA